MARIVPAKPKLRTQYQKDILWRLQGVTSDDYVIFQNRPTAGGSIVLRPGSAPLYLYVMPANSTYDADAWSVDHEDGSSDDLDDLAQEAADFLLEHGVKLGGVAVLGEGLDSRSMTISLEAEDVPLVCIRGVDQANEGMSLPGDTSVEQIQEFLTKAVPGSSSYVPGTVTEGQANLRDAKPVGDSPRPPRSEPESKEQVERAADHDVTAHAEAPVEDIDEEELYPLENVPEPPEGKLTRPVRVPPKVQPFHLNLSSAKRVLHLERMIESYLDTMKRERSLYSFGVEVDSDFVASAEGMLPALLIAASEEWTPVVVATDGHAAFDIRMTKDPEALIGFRIVDVLVSTPSVLYMPLAHILKNSFDGEGYVLDSIIERFSRWIQKYELENTEIDDIGMHIALKALESED